MAIQPQKISDEECASRLAAIEFARRSVRLEGIILHPALNVLNQSFINGDIDDDEHARRCLAAIDAA